MSSGRFICTECKTRYDTGGECPKCPGEPLMDLHNESVRLMLVEQDERVDRAKHYRVVMSFAVVGFLFSLPAMQIVGMLGLPDLVAAIPLLTMTAIGEGVYRLVKPVPVVPPDLV